MWDLKGPRKKKWIPDFMPAITDVKREKNTRWFSAAMTGKRTDAILNFQV